MAEAKVETVAKTKKAAPAAKAGGSAKTAVKKTTTAAKPVAAAKPAAEKKPAARASTARKGKNGVTPEQRYLMICEAAYFKAEQRGFAPESEVQDWLDAESEINRLLGQ